MCGVRAGATDRKIVPGASEARNGFGVQEGELFRAVALMCDMRPSPAMGTVEMWGGGYDDRRFGAAFSVPCVKRPDLLSGLSSFTGVLLLTQRGDGTGNMTSLRRRKAGVQGGSK